MHQDESGHWLREWFLMCGSAAVFGATNTIVGHPLDTIKTKMYTYKGYEGKMLTCIKDLWYKEGLRGFYRGMIPPLWGSALYRSAQFSFYQAHYTYCEQNEPYRSIFCSEIPGCGGLYIRVLTGGFIAGSARALIECPIEYAKVRRQTGQTWVVREAYKGFSVLYPRSTLLLMLYFLQLDTVRRKTNWMTHEIGQFFASGTASTLAFCIIWPFEVLKNHMQASAATSKNLSFIQRVQEIGLRGLYRGILPGTMSIFMRNGAAMVMMQKVQKLITHLGLRH